MSFSEWKIENLSKTELGLPSLMKTRKLPLSGSGIDPVTRLLLPMAAEGDADISLNFDWHGLQENECAGLCLGSPFLNIQTNMPNDHHQKLCWVSNFPPVLQLDEDFVEALSQVELGHDRERINLEKLRKLGHKILIALPATKMLNVIDETQADAGLIIVESRDDLALVRDGLAKQLKRRCGDDFPLVLLGLNNRSPRKPEELSIDAIMQHPLEVSS